MIETKIFRIENYKVVIIMRFLLYQIIVPKIIYMMLFKGEIDILPFIEFFDFSIVITQILKYLFLFYF
jgi:hypothetical protein